MTTTTDTRLVTDAQFRAHAQSVNKSLKEGANPLDYFLKLAQTLAEEYLRCRLYAHDRVDRWETTGALRISDTSYLTHFASAYPVFESPDTGVTVVPLKYGDEDLHRLYSQSAPTDGEVSFYAGYKRNGQDLDAVKAVTDHGVVLSAITVLPDDCPGDLVAGISEVALFAASYVTQHHSTKGGSSRQNLGTQVIERAGRLPRNEVDKIFTEFISHRRRLEDSLLF